MQCGIFDWPAFLSQAVSPKGSISAEIMVMRLALLHMLYRYLLCDAALSPPRLTLWCISKIGSRFSAGIGGVDTVPITEASAVALPSLAPGGSGLETGSFQ